MEFRVTFDLPPQNQTNNASEGSGNFSNPSPDRPTSGSETANATQETEGRRRPRDDTSEDEGRRTRPRDAFLFYSNRENLRASLTGGPVDFSTEEALENDRSIVRKTRISFESDLLSMLAGTALMPDEENTDQEDGDMFDEVMNNLGLLRGRGDAGDAGDVPDLADDNPAEDNQ